MMKWAAAALLLLLLAAATGGFLVWRELEPARPAGGSSILVDVPKGADTGRIARMLEERGVIRNARAFRWLARLSGDAGRIQAGRYELPAGLSAADVLELLVAGRTRLVRVVIPEGLTVEAAARLIEEQTDVAVADYVALARDTLLADSLGVPGPTLEGYLFPETYFVDPVVTARELVELQVRTFKEEFDGGLARQGAARGLSPRELVTLASIVEAEARVATERPVIASVYHNRLRRGMLLEADPTVQYALGGHRDRVLYSDLEVDSPYNTYRNPGLPPGPIGSPGRASLEAAAAPDSTPYLFFFWTGDSLGTHTFSETHAEHVRKRAEMGR